ncbi:MAG TPA: glycosyltransferase family 2 protein [Candidatus Bathyarchaeia archaeon]|nr:glycosyltransferase family 2 protein [Candidatus Bathyarchaeia archaeon]
MDLSIIVVSFNTKDLLNNCLKSIFNQTKGIDFEVIVVDNGSTDSSPETVKSLINQKKPLSLIENKKNFGFAKANNQAIKKARGKYFFLLNSDTILKDSPFSELISFAKKHPQAGVIAPKLLNKDGSKQLSAASFFTLPKVLLWLSTGDRFLFSSPGKACQADWVMGAAMLVRREAIEKAGLMDEDFFMYMEEVEWCFRIKKSGWQIWFNPEAEIYHLVRGSSSLGKEKAVLGIYQGLIYFYQKHFAPWQLGMLKFLLQTKAIGAWLIGALFNKQDLKRTYAQAFKLAR